MNNLDKSLSFITEDESSLRLDVILAERFKGEFSRTYFQKLIESGLVLINGSPVKKRLKPSLNDELEIEFAALPEISLVPENIPLNIVYEDDDLLIVNKPAGMVVHPAPGHPSNTFVNALLFHCRGSLDKEGIRPGIVHRLDKDTTGLLLAAKNTWTQVKLVELFSERKIEKEYMAICCGNPGNKTISLPIARHPHFRQKMGVVPQGKTAITHVEFIKGGATFSLLKILLETGRTHQIRVHLSAIGSPIIGDATYGFIAKNEKYKVSRQLLHARRLKFIHPRTGKVIEVMTDLPRDMEEFINVNFSS